MFIARWFENTVILLKNNHFFLHVILVYYYLIVCELHINITVLIRFLTELLYDFKIYII